jgi:N-acetylglucosaminyl-diphospho-decaprenol L-rhamnosyltransferase
MDSLVPSTTIDLSVIIVNWNTRDLLTGCLHAVEQAMQAITRLDIEVFVVDNASTDGSAVLVQSHFPWVKLIVNTENIGFAAANNQAMCMASGRYVLLLNSDTVIHPGALATLVDFMDRTLQAGACGPRLLNGDESLQHACHPMLTPGREFWRLLFLERVYPRSTYPLEQWDITQPRSAEVIKGACLLLRRTALDQVGLLDENYFMYTEEVDLCHRLRLSGWELWYVPRAEVTHFGGSSSCQMAETMYVQLYYSKLYFYRKFGGDRRARLAKLLYVLAYAPRWLVAAGMAQLRPEYAARARTYGHLLADLPRM